MRSSAERRRTNLARLEEIQEEMLDLLGEAGMVVREEFPGSAANRARAYWLAHVRTALTDDHGYLGGSMYSMGKWINEEHGRIREEEEEETDA